MARTKLRLGSFGGTSRVGDIVRHDGTDYVCKRATSLPPPDAEYWQPVAIHDPAFDVEGPQGRDGRDGIDGRDGRDGASGRDGEPGQSIEWLGNWKRRHTYEKNQAVSHEGSSWLCLQETRTEPTETNRKWSLMAARGEQGERGEAGFSGGRGRPGADGQTVVIENQPQIAATFDSNTARGSVVRVSGAGHVDLAIANATDADALAVGLAIETVASGESGHYVNSGTVSNPSWNWTPGAALYLSPTSAGEMTETFPNEIGNRVVICGTALSPTEIAVGIHWGLVIES